MELKDYKIKREKQNESIEFKQKYLNLYGHKTMLVVYNVLGYFVHQKKQGKKCFLTKSQIRDNLFGKVSFPTIKKAKKVLEHYFGIKTVKIDKKSARNCKYEWVMESDDENPDLELYVFWNILQEKVQREKKEQKRFRFFKFRNFGRWINNLSKFWDRKEKLRWKVKMPSWFYHEDDEEENNLWLKNKKLNL